METHAPVFVVKMLSVEFTTTVRSVVVILDSLAIHSEDVINHHQVCSNNNICKDTKPTNDCLIAPPQNDIIDIRDPCYPTPCGPNSLCRNNNGVPSCSCQPKYIGAPPNCRPECTINQDCVSNLACIKEKCQDPCAGACGLNAMCTVRNHVATCICVEGYRGDPFALCQPPPPTPCKNVIQINENVTIYLVFVAMPPQRDDACDPSPCGYNAKCNDGFCTCLPDYQGDAYTGCRPECVLNSDCSRDKACLRSKCIDPCPGTCAPNAICEVLSHVPMCSCPNGMEGNAFVQCHRIQGNVNLNIHLNYIYR